MNIMGTSATHTAPLKEIPMTKQQIIRRILKDIATLQELLVRADGAYAEQLNATITNHRARIAFIRANH